MTSLNKLFFYPVSGFASAQDSYFKMNNIKLSIRTLKTYWWENLAKEIWQIYSHSPNSPTLWPTKVSHYALDCYIPLVMSHCSCGLVITSLHNCNKSEATDTDQSVALMVAKVTIDTDRWKVSNRNVYWQQQWSHEFVWWHYILWRVSHLTAYYYYYLY